MELFAERCSMITVRSAQDRGAADLGWLDTRHSFSFGNYYDPEQMGFAALRVINEDKIAPGQGFPTHGHRDMEIITYVLAGALEHRDSLGTGAVIRPGDVQRMTAGTGIMHSEYNASELEPGYEQTHFTLADKQGRLKLIGSREGREGSVAIHQDVNLYAAVLAQDETVIHTVAADRVVWVQVARGAMMLNGLALTAGDGAAVSQESELSLTGAADGAEVLLFDMKDR
jgi:redox-sensitive bicupin YhaK (pirin superfamily)